jgi:hypothetical protein
MNYHFKYYLQGLKPCRKSMWLLIEEPLSIFVLSKRSKVLKTRLLWYELNNSDIRYDSLIFRRINDFTSLVHPAKYICTIVNKTYNSQGTSSPQKSFKIHNFCFLAYKQIYDLTSIYMLYNYSNSYIIREYFAVAKELSGGLQNYD